MNWIVFAAVIIIVIAIAYYVMNSAPDPTKGALQSSNTVSTSNSTSTSSGNPNDVSNNSVSSSKSNNSSTRTSNSPTVNRTVNRTGSTTPVVTESGELHGANQESRSVVDQMNYNNLDPTQ